MDRLKDLRDAADPDVARAAALLSSVGPTEPSELRKRRVRAALDRPRRRAGQRLVLRPVAVLVVLVGVVAVASAMVSVGRWIERRRGPRPAVVPAPGAPLERSVGARSAAPVLPVPAVSPVAPVVPLPTAAPVAPVPSTSSTSSIASPPIAPRSPAASVAPSPSRAVEAVVPADPSQAAPLVVVPAVSPPPVAAATPSASAHESQLVSAAMTALRRERDPARASSLLGDYLRQYPDGVLLEEALALAVEAAAARDDPSAADWAVRYLQRFPNGRFRATAHRAIERWGDD